MAKLFGIQFGREIEVKSRPFNEVIEEIANDQASQVTVNVDGEKALAASAALCAVRVIADGLAQVPFKLLKPSAGGGRGEDAKEHPLYNLLRYEPNDWQTSYEFREQIAFHLVLTGNAFVFINRDLRRQPLELYAYEPGSVTVIRDANFGLSYRIQTGKRKTVDYIDIPAEDMWHIKGPSWNGYEGINLTKLAREAIGLSVASERFGANLFKNGARPGGVLSTQNNLTPEQRDALQKSWNSQQAGYQNAHKTAVLSNGLQWQTITSSANEAQWTDARKFQIEEICRVFRVQPVMLMAQGATSYNSVEQLLLAHLTHTLMPWYERLEQSAYKALLSKEDKKAGLYIKLDSRALMENSTAERTAYYNAGRTGGWLTINEIRELEDRKRSNDPIADQLTPAANLFGQQTLPASDNNQEQTDAN